MTMNDLRSTSIMLILATAGLAFGDTVAAAQSPPAGAPPAAAAQGGGRGRGGGLPGATPEQTQAVTDMNAALAEQAAAVTSARAELATVTFAAVKNVAGHHGRRRKAARGGARARVEARRGIRQAPGRPEQVEPGTGQGLDRRRRQRRGRGRGGRGGGL